eukprot:4766138-Prorocentrum_lima.AAC.1
MTAAYQAAAATSAAILSNTQNCLGNMPGRAGQSCIAAMLRDNRVVLVSAFCQCPSDTHTPLGKTTSHRCSTPNPEHAC